MALLIELLPIFLIPILAALIRPDLAPQAETRHLARALLVILIAVAIPACAVTWFIAGWASGEAPGIRDAGFIAQVSIFSLNTGFFLLISIVAGLLAGWGFGSAIGWIVSVDAYFCCAWLGTALLLPPLTQQWGWILLAAGVGALLGGALALTAARRPDPSRLPLRLRFPVWGWIPVGILSTTGGLLVGSLTGIYKDPYFAGAWAAYSTEFVGEVLQQGAGAGLLGLLGSLVLVVLLGLYTWRPRHVVLTGALVLLLFLGTLVGFWMPVLVTAGVVQADPTPVPTRTPLAAWTATTLPDVIGSVALAPDGRQAIVAVDQERSEGPGYLAFWDTTVSATEMYTRPIPTDFAPGLLRLALAPDGQRLALSLGRGTILVYGPPDWQLLYVLTISRDSTVDAEWKWIGVDFSPDGRILAAAACGGNTVWLWRASDGELLRRITVPEMAQGDDLSLPIGLPLQTVVFAPDGQTLATADTQGGVYFWRVADGTQIRHLTRPDSEAESAHKAVQRLAFSRDGRFLMMDQVYETVVIDLATGQIVGRRDYGAPIGFTADGQAVVDRRGAWRVADGADAFSLGGTDPQQWANGATTTAAADRVAVWAVTDIAIWSLR
jgi:hypothetical protein